MIKRFEDIKTQISLLKDAYTLICGARFDNTCSEDINRLLIVINECEKSISASVKTLENLEHINYQMKNVQNQLLDLEKRSEYVRNHCPEEEPVVPEALSSGNDETKYHVLDSAQSLTPVVQHDGVRKNLLCVTPNFNEVKLAVPLTPKPDNLLQISISYVSHTEFNTVPPYIRGRNKAEVLNEFVEIYNRVLSTKYAMIAKYQKADFRRRSVSHNMDLIFQWLEQENQDPINLKGTKGWQCSGISV